MATNRFINVNGGEWNTAANWLLDDDGTTARVPLSTDDVVITASLGTSKEITITTTIGVCKSADFSTAANGFTLTSNTSLRIYGSLTLHASMTFGSFTGTVQFYSSTTGTLRSNGASFGSNAYVEVRAGFGLTLYDDFTATCPLRVYGASASLTTGDNDISCTVFGDNGQTGAVTLTLGSSTINCANVSFGAATLTVTEDTAATINVTCATGADTTMNLGNTDWHESVFVIAAGPGRTLNLAAGGTGTIVDKMKISWATDSITSDVRFWNTFTFSNATADALEIVGAADNRCPLIRTSTTGSPVHLHANTTDITGYICFRDIHFDPHTVDLSAIGSGNCGGNEGITFRTADDLYLDAGTTNTAYDYSNLWSTSSGGGPSGIYPLPQDTLYIDNNSWDDTGNEVDFPSSSRVGTINWSGLTEANTIYFSATYIHGDIIGTGCSNVTVRIISIIYLDPRLKNEASDTQDIDLTYNTLGSGTGGFTVGIYSGNAGTVKLTSACTIPGTMTLTGGTLDLNGNTLTCGAFSSSNSNTRELKDTAGGGGIIVTGVTGTIFDFTTRTNLTVSNAPDLQFGTSALTLTGDVSAYMPGRTFGDVKICKHAGNYDFIMRGFTGSTFGTLTLETPDASYSYSDFQLESGDTINITSLVATGTSSYPISIKAMTGGSAAVFSDTTGTNTVSYCTIQDVTVQGGATWDADDGTNTNVSGNTGWTWPSGASIPILMAYYRRLRAA